MKKISWYIKRFLHLPYKHTVDVNRRMDYFAAKKELGLSNPRNCEMYDKLRAIETGSKEAILRGLLIEATKHNNGLGTNNSELVFSDNPKYKSAKEQQEKEVAKAKDKIRRSVITSLDLERIAVKYSLYGAQVRVYTDARQNPNRAINYADVPDLEGTDIY